MKNDVLSNLSSTALLELLGLQSKPSASTRVLTYVGLVAAGVVVGAAAAVLLTPKTGRQLRSDLRLGAKDLTDQVSAAAASAVAAAKDKLAKGEASAVVAGDTDAR